MHSLHCMGSYAPDNEAFRVMDGSEYMYKIKSVLDKKGGEDNYGIQTEEDSLFIQTSPIYLHNDP